MHGLIRKHKVIYLVAASLSLLISMWLYFRESVVNPDAICYLQSATGMQYGLKYAMHVCDQAKWPFYSIFIYAISQLTHFSYESSAYLIDALFSCVSVVTFISIVSLITDKKRILWFAAFVILLSHEFNSVRQYIVRDHGFWAFYLASIYFLIQYYREHRWRYALAWSVSLIVATLFRVEGLIYLLIVPLFSWLQLRDGFMLRCKSFLQLNTLTILCGLTVFVVIMLHPSIDLTRLHEVRVQFFEGASYIVKHFNETKESLAQHVLSTDSVHDAGSILFLMILSWYAWNIIQNVSIIYFVLVVYAWCKRLLPADTGARLALWSYISLGVLITASFMFEHLFLSKRYMIALSLVLMVWVPFGLNQLVEQWQQRKWPLCLAVFFIVVSAVGGLIDFGYSKKYIHDSGEWLSQNAPATANIYSNDYQVMYYTHRFGDTIFDKARDYRDMQVLANGRWKQYDFLALRVTKQDIADKSNLVNQITVPVVQIFANKRGDQVRIYRRS